MEKIESFLVQRQKLLANLSKDGKIYLMGDFNNPVISDHFGVAMEER